jgi:hypothetical protein
LWVSCALGVQQRDILIGGLICVVTWFTNNHEIWSDNNITIPVIVGSWVLSLVAAPLIDFFNARTPSIAFSFLMHSIKIKAKMTLKAPFRPL